MIPSADGCSPGLQRAAQSVAVRRFPCRRVSPSALLKPFPLHHTLSIEVAPSIDHGLGDAALDYAVNRSYASGLGRFNSADPYQPSGFVVDPQSWNRYAYVQNGPIHNVDPQGLNINCPRERYDLCRLSRLVCAPNGIR